MAFAIAIERREEKNNNTHSKCCVVTTRWLTRGALRLHLQLVWLGRVLQQVVDGTTHQILNYSNLFRQNCGVLSWVNRHVPAKPCTRTLACTHFSVAAIHLLFVFIFNFSVFFFVSGLSFFLSSSVLFRLSIGLCVCLQYSFIHSMKKDTHKNWSVHSCVWSLVWYSRQPVPRFRSKIGNEIYTHTIHRNKAKRREKK